MSVSHFCKKTCNWHNSLLYFFKFLKVRSQIYWLLKVHAKFQKVEHNTGRKLPPIKNQNSQLKVAIGEQYSPAMAATDGGWIDGRWGGAHQDFLNMDPIPTCGIKNDWICRVFITERYKS